MKEEDSSILSLVSSPQFLDKRAHHNALERKRRDHIKESFTSLRDAIPTMQGDKSSRAQILKKASEYIQTMRKKNSSHNKDIDELKKQNGHLEAQIRALERAKAAGTFNSAAEVLDQAGLNYEATSAESAAAGEPAYEASSGSDTSEGSANVHVVTTVSSNGVGGASLLRPIHQVQPGQSLLMNRGGSTAIIPSTNGGEPVTKRMRT